MEVQIGSPMLSLGSEISIEKPQWKLGGWFTSDFFLLERQLSIANIKTRRSEDNKAN